MIWLTLLRKFWPLLAGAGLLLGAWLWHAGQVREAHRDGYAQAQSEYRAALQKVIDDRAEKLNEVSAKYEKRIQDLNESVAIELRGPAIRMCQPTTISVPAPENPGALTGGASDEHAVRTDVDLRRAVVLQGERCEKLRQQLIAIRKLQE